MKTKGVLQTRNPLRQEQTPRTTEWRLSRLRQRNPLPKKSEPCRRRPGQTHERTINPETKSKEREGVTEGRGGFLSSSFFRLSFQADPAARSGSDEAMRRRWPKLETRFRQKETSHRGSILHESCFSFLDETHFTLPYEMMISAGEGRLAM